MDNRERTRVRDKNKGDKFFLETHENFIAVVRKWGMLAASKMKMSGSAKESEQEHTQQFVFFENIQHFLHKKCIN